MADELSLAQLQQLRRKYSYTPYSSQYTSIYFHESERLKQALPEAKFDHVGSTAVKDLGGKPVIDILIQVEDIHEAKGTLIDLGYEFKQHASDEHRLFFDAEINGTLHHLHVCTSDCLEAQRMIAFRDFLRENDEVRAEYDAAKQEASAAALRCYTKQAMKEMYMEIKQPVVNKIMEEIQVSS